MRIVQTHTRTMAFYFLLATTLARAASPPPLRAVAKLGMVAAARSEASQAGAEILAQGGNAVDAAVATALALGVVAPESSGLGGGGFLLYFNAADKRVQVLDFRETAPSAASREMFIRNGK